MTVLTKPRPSTPTPASPRGLLAVYGAWTFVASLLLFWVELMVAKMLLPSFGGSAAVWNTALVFFQVTLLGGYLFAHMLSRLDSRLHKTIQLALTWIPLVTLPVAVPALGLSPTVAPISAVLLSLEVMIGGPFFALSTATPTLHAWFSHSPHEQASDPYFLYALSNVGSLVGLLGYPLVIERLFTLRGQTVLWTFGYGLFALLALVAARLAPRWKPRRARLVERPALSRRVKWAAIAFIPSLALLGVTRHLSTDVAAFPLLWTVPLALYLASFVIGFRAGGEKWIDLSTRSLRYLLIPAVLLVGAVSSELWITVGVPLLILTLGAIAAHGRIYRDRPGSESVTDFYVWVSLGGAAGGLFASLVLPVVSDFVVEYPLALVLFALVAGPPLKPAASPVFPAFLATVGLLGGLLTEAVALEALSYGFAGLVAVVWLRRTWLAGVLATIVVFNLVGGTTVSLAQERTFFGVHRVVEDESGHVLMSGTTSHGAQTFIDGEGRLTALSYYHAEGPVGDVFEAIQIDRAVADVGVIGLGVGSLVSYGGADDTFTFYEIDPMVEEFARDPELFTLLAEAESNVEVIIGDGRLSLEMQPPDHDLLVVDAFTSDAIPVHLLTVEAMESYLASLSEEGRLMVHISNRHLDLEPVVGRISEELDLRARIRRYVPDPAVEGAAPSAWVLIERPDAEPLSLSADWTEAESGDALWTDDYSNILSVVDWR